jgi:hypothetical protein
MAKRRNIIARILIGIFRLIGWIFKGLWYVVRGIGQAIWWLLSAMGRGIASLFGRKSAGTKRSVQEAAQEAHHAEAGHVRHQAEFMPLVATTSVSGDFAAFEERLRKASMIILIAGKRGSGKSALGFRLLENVHAQGKRPAAALGVRAAVLPKWITAIDDVDTVENGSVVLVDEGAVAFSSRESMTGKNKELGKLLAVARHKDLTLILVTQNTGMIDKNVLNLCDTVILKEGSLLQTQMERDAMKEMYKKAADALKKLPAAERQKHAYIIDSDYEGLVSAPLPSFWSEKVSKSRA